MSAAPSQIWVNAPGVQMPEWVVSHMTDGKVREDGSFDIASSTGPIQVERGHCVFAFQDRIFACLPRDVQKQLAAAAGEDNPVVAELAQKETRMAAQREADHVAYREQRKAVNSGEQPLKLKPMVGVPPSPQFLPIDQLQVDDTYQRSIEGGASKTLIRRIAENWDWRLCLPLLVSRRNGALFVIDGQHRLEAAEARGDIPHLPAVVFDFDDPKAEAELFVQANRSRRAMGMLDDFHAAIVAGDAKSLVVKHVVERAGLTIGRNQAWQSLKPGEIVFITAIQRTLKAQGEPIVQEALNLVARAFGDQVMLGVGSIFESLCILMKEREKEGRPIDVSLMDVVLAETGLAAWREAVADVSGGRERIETMLKAITEAYDAAAGEGEE